MEWVNMFYQILINASLLNDVWFKKSSRSGKKYLNKNNFAKLKHSLIYNNYTPIAWKFFSQYNASVKAQMKIYMTNKNAWRYT